MRLEWHPFYTSEGMSLVEYRVIAQVDCGTIDWNSSRDEHVETGHKSGRLWVRFRFLPMLLYGGLCWQVNVCVCFSWHGQFFWILGRPTRLLKWEAYHGSGHHSAMWSCAKLCSTDFLFHLRRKSRLGMKTLGFRPWTLYGLRIKRQQRKLSRVLRDVCFLNVSWCCFRWWHVSFQMAGKAWRPSQPRSQTFQIFSDPFGPCLLSLPCP